MLVKGVLQCDVASADVFLAVLFHILAIKANVDIKKFV